MNPVGKKKIEIDKRVLAGGLIVLASLSLVRYDNFFKHEKSIAVRVLPAVSEGMTQNEVIGLLGQPSGTMTVSGRPVLLYGGVMLFFAEGGLIAPSEEDKKRLSTEWPQTELSSPAPSPEPLEEAGSPEQATPSKITHPVFLKAERAIYDAERAAHERTRAVSPQDYTEFIGFEEWKATR